MRAVLLAALLFATPALAKKPKPEPAPEPAPVAEPAPAPAAEPEPAPAAADEAPKYGPIDRPAVHLTPDEVKALLPEGHLALGEVLALYADFCANTLGDDEAANTELLTVTMPAELDALTAKGMEVVKAGGHDAPAAAVFVLAEARLAYADLTYSLTPTSRMNEKQAAKFWELLNTQVWPTMDPVDAEARAYLESITKGAREGSPWREHAQAALDRMDAANRAVPAGLPTQTPTITP